MRVRQFLVAVMMATAPVLAFAQDDTNPVPEPAMLALLGIGAVALIVARANKRK